MALNRFTSIVCTPHRRKRLHRVTINDVARRAGVSKGAASFALNGRPGVSEATRARVLEAATELGWVRNAAAKALSDGRSQSIGLVMNRPPQVHGVEPLLQHYLEGVQDELTSHEVSLLIQVVPGHPAELATYKEWALSGRVDGLVVIDLRVDDDRPRALLELGVPAVFLGDPRYTAGVPSVWCDERAVAAEVAAHLRDLGHTRIARVGDRAILAHSAARAAAFEEACRAAGGTPLTVSSTGSRAECASSVRAMLEAPDRPTALVFDSDVQAIVGMSVIQDLGLSVPDDVSVVAWDATGLAEVLSPPLTVVDHDARADGAQAVRLLLATLDGAGAVEPQAPTPSLLVRRSTGPAPAA